MNNTLTLDGLDHVHTQLLCIVEELRASRMTKFTEDELSHLIAFQGLSEELSELLHEIL